MEAEPQAPATQLQPRAPGPLGNMLAHADRVRSLSAADLSAEIARLNDATNAAGNGTLLMQQGHRAGTDPQPGRSGPRAGPLLIRRVMADNSDNGRALQPLARLLAARFQEQRRVEDDRDRQAQRVKDAQRAASTSSTTGWRRCAIRRNWKRNSAAPPTAPAPPA